jgi:hypothetical protein
MPITALPVPVAVPIRVPIRAIPILVGVNCRAIVGVNCRAIVCMDDGPIGPSGMISAIGATNSRATSGVDRSSVTSLDGSAIAVMSYFTVFTLVRIRVERSG